MHAEAVWAGALEYIQARVPKQVFDTWFIPLRLQGIEQNSARLLVPNKFFGDWLREHYAGLLSEALVAVHGKEGIGVAFIPGDRQDTAHIAMAAAQKAATGVRARKPTHLNPKYTFGRFVVGASNQFAHAA